MEKKHILFTGGGTAGHVMVNLAMIPVYQRNGWTIDYIGSSDGIEKKLIKPLENVTYHSISTGKLRRYMSVENLKDPFKVMKGTWQAFRIIGHVQPAVVFSKGGFVSVPVVMAAKFRGVPTVIHESDITPGLANKIAIPFAKKVLATFEETMAYLPEKKREHVGAVIRDDLFNGKKQTGLEYAGLTGNKPVLLVMGGSGGAETINQAVRASLDSLLNEFQIIHICGEGKTDPSLNRPGYVQFDYINEALKDILAATDCVISRAGSNAIFEFLALRIPMLLIPLSRQASRGDQIMNAQSFEKQNFARILEEESLTPDTLTESVLRLKRAIPVIIDHMQTYKTEAAKERVIDIISEMQKQHV